MPRDKIRIRFCKSGDLRLLSHHDLMRCFERAIRRAELPARSSEGFHPKPRIVFALSLSLGVIGHQEVVELGLDEAIEPAEVQARLATQMPNGLTILSAKRIPTNLTGRAVRAVYRLPVPPDRLAGLAEAVADLLAREHVRIDRIKPEPRTVDIRPYLHAVRVGPDFLEMSLIVTPTGTARADEVPVLLGLGDLLEDGAILERVTLELHDETEEGEQSRAEIQTRDVPAT